MSADFNSISPDKEKLPAWKNMDECRAYCEEKGDNFYLTAFLFEVWSGIIITKIVEQYATIKSGRRHLQTGIGWEAWKAVFGHATPDDWPHILESFERFTRCDTPEGEMIGKVCALMAMEDQYAEPVSVSSFSARVPSGEATFASLLECMQYYFQRMAEWMEALLHWDTHQMAAVAPITFGSTEAQRELANIGLMQAGFAGLSEHGKEWWQFRHEALAKEFAGQRDWRLVGKAQSLEKFGELRQPAVDELTVHWWPLLTRYHWTDRDMRRLLKRVVPHPDAYPLREDKEFADYRKKALGLLKAKTRRDKSSQDGKPTGWRMAMAMVGRLSE